MLLNIGFTNRRENVIGGEEWGKRRNINRIQFKDDNCCGVLEVEYTAGYHTQYCTSGTICLVKFEWVEAGDAQGCYFGVLNNA